MVSFEIKTKTITPEEFENKQKYGEKSFVAMAVAQCPVTGCLWEPNTLLLDRRICDSLHRQEFIGREPLPEVQKMWDDGYVALIEADPEKSTITGETAKPEDVYRTGTILWLKKTVAKDMLNMDTPMAFVDPEVVARIRSMIPNKG